MTVSGEIFFFETIFRQSGRIEADGNFDEEFHVGPNGESTFAEQNDSCGRPTVAPDAQGQSICRLQLVCGNHTVPIFRIHSREVSR